MEKKSIILAGYSSLLVFIIGTFLPKVEGGLFRYDAFAAIAWVMVSFIFLEWSYSWIIGRAIGWIGVASTSAWLFRELSGTADLFSWVNVIVGAITVLILIIQYKYRDK